MSADLAELYRYFRDRKRAAQIVSPHGVAYGTESAQRLIGRAVSTEYISRRFAAASVAAGFKPGQYPLRDLRPKGLTDEARIVGAATDKGGHPTEQMKRHDVRVSLPPKGRSQIRRIRGGGN